MYEIGKIELKTEEPPAGPAGRQYFSKISFNLFCFKHVTATGRARREATLIKNIYRRNVTKIEKKLS